MHVRLPELPARNKANLPAWTGTPIGWEAGSVTGSTALLSALSADQRLWLIDHAKDRYQALNASMTSWRLEMARCERRMNDDYSDRETKSDSHTDDLATIFARQNESLGVVSGFCDFGFAQAKDDILGGDDWLAVTPVGASDDKLANQIRKHAPLKLEQSRVLDVVEDALQLAPHLGTSFVKVAWREEAETYEAEKSILIDKATKKPIPGPDGNPITSKLVKLPAEAALPVNDGDGPLLGIAKKAASSVLPGKVMVHPEGLPEMKLDPAKVEYASHYVEETAIVENGVALRLIDHGDISFDTTAQSLDLVHTPVFCRFKIGLLDAAREFGLSQQQYEEALSLIETKGQTGAETPREERSEEAPARDNSLDPEKGNPEIVLVEGYLRCDPFGKRKPVRIHIVFSPELEMIFTADYLANVTLKGTLPIFPVRWFRTPGRIMGRGYHTRYEKPGDKIDDLYSGVTWRDRQANQPMTGFNRSALKEPEKADDPDFLSRPVELEEGKKMDDLLSFATIPDASERSVELLNQMLQMLQMRSGITSASQGELKGVPSANTATGTKQIISRGAVLLKWPIEDCREDCRRMLEYAVKLLYANQDTDETFAWGEGDAREIIELKADQVRNIDVDVVFSLSQTQNQELMQNAQAAANFVTSYLGIPEPEKASVRPLFVQILNCLGFRNAEQIIREPIQMAVGPDGMPLDPAAPVGVDPARMDESAA
jgi:hypothetical protein